MKIFLVVLYLSQSNGISSFPLEQFQTMRDCERKMTEAHKRMPLVKIAAEYGFACIKLSPVKTKA